jgi:hypothetical protein
MFNTTTIEKLKAKAIELLDLRRITLRKNEGEHLAAAAAPPPPLLTITNFSNPDIQLDASQNLIAVIDVNDEKPVFAPHPKNSIIRDNDFKKFNIAENILGASFNPFKEYTVAFYCIDNFVRVIKINSLHKKNSIQQSPMKVFIIFLLRLTIL